ncbi:MAG: hypothetical protein VB137_15050 [Burkholderia sp.]
MTQRYPAALLLDSTLLCAGAHAETLHPVKLSKAELAGPVFQRPGVVKVSRCAATKTVGMQKRSLAVM